MTKISIFASGSGTNAENIFNYFKENQEIKVDSIISNKNDAFVHERAKNLGIDSFTFSKKEFDETGNIINLLQKRRVDFIVLAGFLLKIPQNLIETFPNKIINIHPALLPKYGGKGMYGDKVHEAVVAAGEKESGITIHYINEHYDEGNIIFQATCEVNPTDSAQEVAHKVHVLEYKYFPQIIEKVITAVPKTISLPKIKG